MNSAIIEESFSATTTTDRYIFISDFQTHNNTAQLFFYEFNTFEIENISIIIISTGYHYCFTPNNYYRKKNVCNFFWASLTRRIPN